MTDSAPALDRARHAQRAGAVAGPDRARQAVDRVVGEADRLVLALERDHRGDRTEDLLARGAVVVRRPGRGRSARTRSRGRRARCPGTRPARRRRRRRLTFARWSAEMSGPISVASSSGSPTRSASTALSSSGMKRVERAALDEDPRARAAVLAGVAEHRQRRRGGGGLEVRVGEDDVRRLAAELERHSLDRVRGERADPPARPPSSR